MIAGLLIGLVAGLAAGVGLGWVLFRRPAGGRPETVETSPHPVVAPAITEPRPAGPEAKPTTGEAEPAPDDDLKRTLDATQGLLDDLESRYRKGGPRPPA